MMFLWACRVVCGSLSDSFLCVGALFAHSVVYVFDTSDGGGCRSLVVFVFKQETAYEI